jgi:hypothetical protein
VWIKGIEGVLTSRGHENDIYTTQACLRRWLETRPETNPVISNTMVAIPNTDDQVGRSAQIEQTGLLALQLLQRNEVSESTGPACAARQSMRSRPVGA